MSTCPFLNLFYISRYIASCGSVNVTHYINAYLTPEVECSNPPRSTSCQFSLFLDFLFHHINVGVASAVVDVNISNIDQELPVLCPQLMNNIKYHHDDETKVGLEKLQSTWSFTQWPNSQPELEGQYHDIHDETVVSANDTGIWNVWQLVESSILVGQSSSELDEIGVDTSPSEKRRKPWKSN